MPQHVYQITIGAHDYEVSSPSELSDAQAYQAALAQSQTEETKPPTLRAQSRSRTGQMYDPESAPKPDMGAMASRFADAFNPLNLIEAAKGAVRDPIGAIKNVAMTPVRLAGEMVGGDASGALGELGAMAVQGKAIGAIPGRMKLRAIEEPTPAGATRIAPQSDAAYEAASGHPRGQFPQAPKPPPPADRPLVAQGPDAASAFTADLRAKLAGPTTPEAFTANLRERLAASEAENVTLARSLLEKGYTPDAAAKIAGVSKGLLNGQQGIGRIELMANPKRAIPIALGELAARHFGAPPFVGGVLGAVSPEIMANPTAQEALRVALIANLTGQAAQR